MSSDPDRGTSTAQHWAALWSEGDDDGRSWHQEDVSGTPSLRLIASVAPTDADVVDVGGGSSPLVDALLDRGHPRPVVVDIADEALEHSRRRLGDRADQVDWVVADVRTLDLGRQVDVWHDRAVLHFLVEDDDRDAYADVVDRHLRVGGHAVIGAFAMDGPTSCSGLPVRRYDAERLQALLGDGYELVALEPHTHHTPSGDPQRFLWGVLRRLA